MQFSRARYVTLCQQSLVTAAVLAVGVSAAGVSTLDIVPDPGARQQGLGQTGMQAATEVAAAPVAPKVREVEVAGISEEGPTAPLARGDGQRLVALSDPEPVRGYATVGVTWEHGAEISDRVLSVQFRTEKAGAWSDWLPAVYHDEHAPNSGSAELGARGERPGTDALIIGDVDHVQMSVESTDGTAPPDLQLAVINPGEGETTEEAPAIDTSQLAEPGAPAAPSSGGTAALSAMDVAAQPYIYSRAQWGANEGLRDQSQPSRGTVKTGFIHHTVNANTYSSAQVPALLRGIYAYHTQSRGWRDIGYNYLVDRFGRIWEGRYGGVGSPIVGAHTSGYNEVSFAMSAIGNYDIANPPQAVSDAYARLFAWKLSLYDIRADNPRIYVKNRYLRAINGHRDAGSTACPGRYLYAKLPGIRTAAQRLQGGARPATPPPVRPPATPAAPASPAYTGPSKSDARCTPRAINRRSYGPTTATKRSDLVVPLQCLLKQQGLYPYVVTGRWNARNVSASRTFQARVRHRVSSEFSRSDWTALLVTGKYSAVLTPGRRGSDVVRVQRALNAALGRKVPVTGVYNKRTRKAVGAYQRRVNVKPTRVVAAQTWAALSAGRR